MDQLARMYFFFFFPRKSCMFYDWWMDQVQILHTKKPNREARVKHIEVFVQEQKYLEG